MENDILKIGEYSFRSRLFLGTGKFPALDLMEQAVIASNSELVTTALKRFTNNESKSIVSHLQHKHIQILPNTSGARDANEAILAAHLSAEALETKILKLEIHPDPKYLLPDGEETLKAAKQLVKDGFTVLPYVHADPVLCKKLEDVGTAAVMPLGAPIGTNKGLTTLDFLDIIIEQSEVPVVVDAGIGAPSQAAQAMEMGADAVLVNTAIAIAQDPVEMAIAFAEATIAGRRAFLAKLATPTKYAHASSPLTDFLS